MGFAVVAECWMSVVHKRGAKGVERNAKVLVLRCFVMFSFCFLFFKISRFQVDVDWWICHVQCPRRIHV